VFRANDSRVSTEKCGFLSEHSGFAEAVRWEAGIRYISGSVISLTLPERRGAYDWFKRGEGAMSAEAALLAYAACGLVIVVYAWLRSTPPAGLAFLMLVYLMLGAAVFTRFDNLMARDPGGVVAPGTIARLQLVTGGLLGWLMAHRSAADNTTVAAARFSGFVVKSILAVVIGIGISLCVDATASEPFVGAGHDLRPIVIGLPLCLAAVFFRDHRVRDGKLPTWLRCAENCGCTSTMALGLLMLYLGQLVPLPIDALHGWRLAVTLTLPAVLAMVIGGCVPYLGRADFRGSPGRPGELVGQPQG
jgi:hypothetical protein